MINGAPVHRSRMSMKRRRAAGAAFIAVALSLLPPGVAFTAAKPPASTAATTEVFSVTAGWEYLQNNTPAPAKATTAGAWVPVDLPHTWNAFDSVDTVPGYRRDASWYRKSITIGPAAPGTRHALLFEAANMKADVYLNGV